MVMRRTLAGGSDSDRKFNFGRRLTLTNEAMYWGVRTTRRLRLRGFRIRPPVTAVARAVRGRSSRPRFRD